MSSKRFVRFILDEDYDCNIFELGAFYFIKSEIRKRTLKNLQQSIVTFVLKACVYFCKYSAISPNKILQRRI